MIFLINDANSLNEAEANMFFFYQNVHPFNLQHGALCYIKKDKNNFLPVYVFSTHV